MLFSLLALKKFELVLGLLESMAGTVFHSQKIKLHLCFGEAISSPNTSSAETETGEHTHLTTAGGDREDTGDGSLVHKTVQAVEDAQ